MRIHPLLPATLAALFLAQPLWAEPAPAAGGAPEPGAWRSQKTELVYMGFTSTYSCDGLQGKLELLLRQLGARPGFKVNAYGCLDYGRPSRFARATLEFATLQPADAGSINPAAAAGEAVSGSWRTVELSPHHPFDLQDGDCELMEQFRDKVLPLFATRGLDVHATCVPHQDTGGPFDLRMQVFAPLPVPKPPKS
ncbi:MAG TPA: hypothetical protein VGL50_01605 [Steroidobacteraceae bacterium]|jgi:hypothetical protein